MINPKHGLINLSPTDRTRINIFIWPAAEAAGAQLPPRHRAVGFHFQGKAIGPGAPLASYGVRRGDTVRADVRREPFELARTGPPLPDGAAAEVVGDGARE